MNEMRTNIRMVDLKIIKDKYSKFINIKVFLCC